MNVLEEWLRVAADDLGVDAAVIDRDLVLGLTRDVAHSVARPAAPLTAYLLGIAVGRDGSDPQKLREHVERLARRAADWSTPDS